MVMKEFHLLFGVTLITIALNTEYSQKMMYLVKSFQAVDYTKVCEVSEALDSNYSSILYFGFSKV